jgi:hypothetical protein
MIAIPAGNVARSATNNPVFTLRPIHLLGAAAR